MFSFLKRSHKERNHCFLALDIGTEFVKALICTTEGRKGTVRGVGRKHQKLGEMQGGVVTDIAGVIENCSLAIKDAEKMAGIRPDQLIMGIAGELVKGATSSTNYTRQDPESKIDMDELRTIIHKVQWKAFDAVRAQLAFETGYNEIDVKLVNAAIVDVKIDGYKVSNPLGFQGKDVTISIFNAFAPLVHFGALQTIAAELDFDLLAITAEPYAVARCLGDEDGDLSAIFIDIGGGTTDIAIVREGTVEGTKMFTLGGRSFTKRLAQNLNISFPEAEEIKVSYANDRLEKQSHKIVRDCMKNDADVWLSGVALTLSEFDLDVLPSRIMLCGGGSHLPEIKEALETRDWTKGLPFTRKPHISFIQPKHVTNILDSTQNLTNPQDVTPMALANLALELAGEERILAKMLRKVVRLMQV